MCPSMTLLRASLLPPPPLLVTAPTLDDFEITEDAPNLAEVQHKRHQYQTNARGIREGEEDVYGAHEEKCRG